MSDITYEELIHFLRKHQYIELQLLVSDITYEELILVTRRIETQLPSFFNGRTLPMRN